MLRYPDGVHEQHLWVVFTPMGSQAVLMEHTAAFEDDVNPAMSAALESGPDVMTLHNGFFYYQ